MAIITAYRARHCAAQAQVVVVSHYPVATRKLMAGCERSTGPVFVADSLAHGGIGASGHLLQQWRQLVMVQDEFWNWFMQLEAELFAFDPDQETERERLFFQVTDELRKVDPDLTFEFGPKARRREFVISAGGIKRAFPAVASLGSAAPHLDRWQVTTFRPRRPVTDVVRFRDKRVDPMDVQFSLLDNGEIVGIFLFIPGYRESDADLKQVGYLLLDEMLGEYDVESRLGPIEMFPPSTPTKGDRHPLAELSVLFDELTSRLEGQSGKERS